MEPHPVPQDILNTEFKLFGSFTLKQFLKLVIACLIGLGIFLLNIPALIKYPLIIASILIGVAIAIIPRFGTWFSNYIKAIFISPRYVWEQTTEAPDIFRSQSKSKTNTSQKVSSNKTGDKIDLDEISLQKLLAARDNPRKSTPLVSKNSSKGNINKLDEPVRQGNIDRVINNVFEDQPKISQTKAPVPDQSIYSGHNANQKLKSLTKEKTKQDYINEINALKQQLKTLVRDQNFKEKESGIMHRINDLTYEIKMMDETGENFEGFNKPELKAIDKIVNMQGEKKESGQIVFGIVVDKKGKPVQNATVVFDDENGDRDVETVSKKDGKFSTNKKLEKGKKYNVSINHPNISFHTYVIKVGEGKLPAYKLRAK